MKGKLEGCASGLKRFNLSPPRFFDAQRGAPSGGGNSKKAAAKEALAKKSAAHVPPGKKAPG